MALIFGLEMFPSLIITILMLTIFSWQDIVSRRVPNKLILISGIFSLIVVIASGHFQEHLIQHIIAPLFVFPLSLYLFRIGAIGGADAKVLWFVAITSPGIEVGLCSNPFLEVILAAGFQIILMLIYAKISWSRNKEEIEKKMPALIPVLLIAYLITQFFVLVC